MIIDVEYVSSGAALILLAPTGIKYTAQSGGMMCSHPEAEGFLIGLGETFGEGVDDCTGYCQYLSYQDEYGSKLREKLAPVIDAYLKEYTSRWRWKIEFDFERIDELQEGWWPVKAKGLLDEFHKDSFLNHKGYIHTGNCD